jgi:FkbM family methyltransferase
MTPILKLRSFSNDQYYLDKIFYANAYNLKGFPEGERKPVVLDIGAHCGYFSFAALSLGAKKVYAFEPFTPNYKMLLQNIGDNPIGPVIPYQLGVYVAPVILTFGYPQLIDKSFFDFANVHSEINATNPEFCKCCMLSLDTILEYCVGEQVDIMKISICHGTVATLAMSNLLKERVSNICGEIFIKVPSEKQKLEGLLSSKGFIDISVSPVEEEENKMLFQASKTSLKEAFI